MSLTTHTPSDPLMMSRTSQMHCRHWEVAPNAWTTQSNVVVPSALNKIWGKYTLVIWILDKVLTFFITVQILTTHCSYALWTSSTHSKQSSRDCGPSSKLATVGVGQIPSPPSMMSMISQMQRMHSEAAPKMVSTQSRVLLPWLCEKEEYELHK